EVIDRLVARMREMLCGDAKKFTDEEIKEGLAAPQAALVAWQSSLPRLRHLLSPYFQDVTTDDDLLRALKNPHGPLWASGACQIQVLRRRSADDWNLFFTPGELGRRLTAELTPLGREAADFQGGTSGLLATSA